MKLALFFPGQGSQGPGMGRWLFDEFEVARRTFEEASDALSIDLKKLCFEGPEDELQKTENTQPAILTTSVVYFRCLHEIIDLVPLAAAGHSIGEYAALVTASVISFDSAVRAVRERGLAMQRAVPLGLGGMSAILNLDEHEVRSFCLWATQESQLGLIEAANFNTPGQTVISGVQATLDWAQANWSIYNGPGCDKKMRWIPLKVSAPFHCSLMKPAQERMKVVLDDIPFRQPQWSIIQNFTAKETIDPEELRQNLVQQVSGAVQWTESVRRATYLGATKGLELGHGQVLRGLNKKIDPNFETLNVQTIADLQALEKQIHKQKDL